MTLSPPMTERSDTSLVEVLSAEPGTYTPLAVREAEAEFARRQLSPDLVAAVVESRRAEAKRRSTLDLPGLPTAIVIGLIVLTPPLAMVVLGVLAIGLEDSGYTGLARVLRVGVGGLALLFAGIAASVVIS